MSSSSSSEDRIAELLRKSKDAYYNGQALVSDASYDTLEGGALRSAALTGKSACFTGAQPRKRSDLEKMVVVNGGEVRDSVTKGLTYLVMADPGSTSSKAKRAREVGTECIDLAALERIIREGGGVVEG